MLKLNICNFVFFNMHLVGPENYRFLLKNGKGGGGLGPMAPLYMPLNYPKETRKGREPCPSLHRAKETTGINKQLLLFNFSYKFKNHKNTFEKNININIKKNNWKVPK